MGLRIGITCASKTWRASVIGFPRQGSYGSGNQLSVLYVDDETSSAMLGRTLCPHVNRSHLHPCLLLLSSFSRLLGGYESNWRALSPSSPSLQVSNRLLEVSTTG